MPSHHLLDAALRYAARGWRVFLLGRTKRPVGNCPGCRAAGPEHDRETCDCLTCHGFYAATTDPDRIHAMLTRIPYGLLAIRTGAPSGIVVVDIDPDHGGSIVPDLMPPTAAVRTGSGGWHLYYRHPGHPIRSRPLPGFVGVDIKGDGGYVVAPPSTHPRTRRPYQWTQGREIGEMRPALRAFCTTPDEPRPPGNAAPVTPSPVTARRAGRISDPDALLAAHLRAVARAPEGRRRTVLYGAARGVARMVTAGALTPDDARRVLTDAGRAGGQTDRDIHAAITGAFRDEGVSG